MTTTVPDVHRPTERLRSYLAIARAGVQMGLAYRVGAVFAAVGNLVYLAVTHSLWKAVYGGRPVLNGLTFEQAYLYVALGSTVFALLKTYVDWFVADEIRTGSLAVRLVRPHDLQLQILAETVGLAALNLVTVVLPAALLVFGVFGIDVPQGRGVWLFPVAISAAFVLSFLFDWIVGLTGFITESIWGIATVKETVIIALSGSLVPLAFFPAGLRAVLDWLPFRAIYAIPLGLLVEPDRAWSVLLGELAVQFGWIALIGAFTRWLWHLAARDLRIAGG